MNGEVTLTSEKCYCWKKQTGTRVCSKSATPAIAQYYLERHLIQLYEQATKKINPVTLRYEIYRHY